MFKKIVDNIIDIQVKYELQRRKDEIQKIYDVQEQELKYTYQSRLTELSLLNKELTLQISLTEKSRLKAEEEQKKLWEKLDILKDNLNTQDVWVKLWENAFSKAVDIVWDLMQEKVKDIVKIAEEKSYEKASKEKEKIISEFKQTFQNKVEGLDINKAMILNTKEEVNKQYLIHNRTKDLMRQEYYRGQLDLIKRLLNEKD